MSVYIGTEVAESGNRLAYLESQLESVRLAKKDELLLTHMTVGFEDNDMNKSLKLSMKLDTEMRAEIRRDILNCYQRDLFGQIEEEKEKLKNLLLTKDFSTTTALNGGIQ